MKIVDNIDWTEDWEEDFECDHDWDLVKNGFSNSKYRCKHCGETKLESNYQNWEWDDNYYYNTPGTSGTSGTSGTYETTTTSTSTEWFDSSSSTSSWSSQSLSDTWTKTWNWTR